MENTGKYMDLHSLEIVELERLVERFPWYTHARQLILYKLAAMGEECFEQKFRDFASFLHSRAKIFNEIRAILAGRDVTAAAGAENRTGLNSDLPEIEIDEIIREEQVYNSGRDTEQKPRVHILGGDYFTREDFEKLKEEEKVEKVGRFVPKGDDTPLVSYTDREPLMREEDFESPSFYTETLAAIYAEQGYYEQAINVYAKLILLYPEKSTYFAALVDEIKLKKII